MTSIISNFSRASQNTQKILEDLSKKSETMVMKLEANVDQSTVNNAWAAFGLYLSRQIRMGRAINVPKFGLVTFAAPEVKLEGVTNPNQRDIRLRKPVFIINKDFAKGLNIKSGIYADFGVRPYSLTGVTAGFGQVKANYTEIAAYAGLDKDTTRICVERIIRELAEKARNAINVEMEIPNLGTLYIKGNIAAINFDELLVNEAIDATNKVIKEKRININRSSLTSTNLQYFLAQTNPAAIDEEDCLEIDQSAQNYLKTMLGIDAKDLKSTDYQLLINLKTRKFCILALTKSSKSEEFFKPFDTKSFFSQNAINQENNPFETKSTVKFNHRASTTNLETRENTIKLAPLSDLEKAKKKIRFWIRNKSLISDECFAEIVANAIGITGPSSLEVKLSIEDFEKGIKKVNGLNIEKSEMRFIYHQIQNLFSFLDDQNTGLVSLKQWQNHFPDDGNHMNRLKDIISKYNLQCDDIYRRMGLNRDASPINTSQLAIALSKLDPSLSEILSSKMAVEIMQNNDKITMKDLITVIGCSEEANDKDNWFKQKIISLKKKIGLDKLRIEFEKCDEKNQGILDTASFKAILSKAKMGLSAQEVNKFTRYIEKDINMNIDYYKFMKLMEDTKGEDDLKLYSSNKDLFLQDEISQISTIIANYLKDNKISPVLFLKKIQEKKRNGNSPAEDLFSSKRVTKEDFSEMLYSLFKEHVFNKNVLVMITSLIDLDHDGIIDENDLYIYLSRYGYIDLKASIKNNMIDITKAGEIFPREPLSEQKLELLLKDLRQILNRRKITYYDFVRQIDTNDVGFISINKLSAGLDKVMKLSQPAKDGLFAYLDKQKIGLVDPKDILKLLNRTAIDKNIEVTEDNFDWQNQVVNKIKSWCVEKKLKPEDAFRIMDMDFDGSVSKKDLTSFLKEVIKLPSSEINSPRVDRLYKLLDAFKRDDIQFNDIKRLFEKDDLNDDHDIFSGGKSLNGRSSLDWKMHAKQQLGLILSKKFPSLLQSFEEISLHTMKVTYKHFSTWIEENMALSGFNLTEKLMHQLFADLDPHKKGHLTQVDWENAFVGFHAENQILNEIQDVLNANFASVNEAFEFFLENEKSPSTISREFTFNGLKTSINSLLPKRFTSSQINWLWKKVAEDSDIVGLSKFKLTFDNDKYTGQKKISSCKYYYYYLLCINIEAFYYVIRPQINRRLMNKSLDASNLLKHDKKMALSPCKLTRTTTATDGFVKVLTKQEKQEKVCEKMKIILNAANIPIEEFYRQMDSNNNGQISTLEFINAIKRLNLGLTLQEIEDIVNHCDRNSDGKISFSEFMKKFQPKQKSLFFPLEFIMYVYHSVNDHRIFDRSRHRLKKIKDNIYSYMLSPKDAFLQFNEDRTGKLTYGQFNKLIMTLALLAKEEQPTFSIVKDLFDFIDIRKDGIIDLTEWMQSFRLVEVILASQQKQLNNHNALNQSDIRREPKSFDKRAHTVGNSLWASKGEFQSSMSQIKLPRNEQLTYSLTKEKSSKSIFKIYNTPSALSEWECTKEYDDVMKIIGRNRKTLIGTFSEINKAGIPITFQKAKEVLIDLLNHNGIAINEEYWPYLLKAAEKDSIIDYKFLLDLFKERCKLLTTYPKANIIPIVQKKIEGIPQNGDFSLYAQFLWKIYVCDAVFRINFMTLNLVLFMLNLQVFTQDFQQNLYFLI